MDWSAWDHIIQDFDSSKPNYGVVAEHPELIDLNYLLDELAARGHPADWINSNGIDYNPELDQIVLSTRRFSEVWIIDHSTTTTEAAGSEGGNSGMGGDLLYRWGNPRAYRAGTPDDQQLFWQHNPEWIPPGQAGAGNIVIFNNGLEFTDFLRGYSSIDEIVPPVDGGQLPAGLRPGLWAGRTGMDLYRRHAQRLLRPLHLRGATAAQRQHADLRRVNGTIFEVTPAGKTVWKYVNPASGDGPLRQGEPVPMERLVWATAGEIEIPVNQVYRAYRYAPDYPGLQGLDLTPGAPIELYDTP